MKLTASFILQLLAGAASAVSEARVYIFPRCTNADAIAPTLSSEQARLIFAKQMGVTEYHSLGSPGDETISYINEFGLPRDPLAQDIRTLLVVVEGVSSENQDPLLNAFDGAKPAFKISNPPSYRANEKLVRDLNFQAGATRGCQFQDAINPFADKCWSSSAKATHVDLKKATIEQITHMEYKRLASFASNGDMNAIVVLMPESSRRAKTSSAPYGSYEKPSQAVIGRRTYSEQLLRKKSLFKGIFSDSQSEDTSASNATIPLTSMRNVCFESLDSCNSGTGNCTSRGSCQRKYASEDGKSACYVCKCNSTLSNGISFGGWACQKRDISGPFWLLLISSIVLMGLVGWSIGMLYSIGEEPLPGVISAGVSNTKSAR